MFYKYKTKFFIEYGAHIKPNKKTFSLRTVLLHQSLWPGLLSTSHHFIVVQTISDGNTGGSLGKHVDFGMKGRIRNITCFITVSSFTILSSVLGRRKNKECSLSCRLVFTLLINEQKKRFYTWSQCRFVFCLCWVKCTNFREAFTPFRNLNPQIKC